MDIATWPNDPANFPGKYGALYMKFIEARRAHKNVTDATVKWYCTSWIVFRDSVVKATTERELKQQIYDGITIISKRGVGPVSVNTYLRAWQAFLGWCLELEYLDKPIKLPKQKEPEVFVRVLTREQMETLFHSEPRDAFDLRVKTAIIVMLDCGLRCMEWTNLKVEDVDFRTRTLRVYGKGRRERIVPMSQNTADLLFKHLAERPETSDVVFATRDGQPMNRSNALHTVKRYAVRCGIPASAIALHRLRHTMASYQANSGCPLPSLQKILGHRHITTTMRYVTTAIPDLQRDHGKHSVIGKMK